MSASRPATNLGGPDSVRAWRLLVGAAVIGALGAQGLWGPTLGLFLRPMSQDLGWSRADIGLVTALTAVASFVFVPIAGWLIDRVCLRPVILVAVLCQGACIALGSQLHGGVWHFYALVFGLMIFGTGASLLTLSKVVRGWFDQSLGKAIGALFAIVSLGHIVNPLVAQSLISHFGWRDAYVALGIGSTVVTVLVAWFVIRDRDSPAAKPSSSTGQAAATSMRELLAHRAWWVLAAYSALFGYATSGIAFHFAALLQDRGATAGQSAVALSLGAAGGLVGNLASGWLIDRVSARFMASLVMLLPFAGVLLLLGSGSVMAGLSAAIVLGLSTGSEGSVIAVLTGRYFGNAIYGRAYSTQMVAASLGSGIAPYLVGVLQERSGNYTIALTIAATAFGLAALSAWLLPAMPGAFVGPTVEPSAVAA